MKIPPPKSEAELIQRAENLKDRSLGELALLMNLKMPENFSREKGFIGQLLELVLGASAGSKSEPDFQTLGIELKTLPLKINGQPKESTYVSIVPLLSSSLIAWRESAVYAKLRRVLWIPYLFDKASHPQDWLIKAPILWSPSTEDERVLKNDWQELMSMVQMGELAQIDARLGEYLQIRPKGMNASARRQGLNEEGQAIATSPLGFYLRPEFTNKILMP